MHGRSKPLEGHVHLHQDVDTEPTVRCGQGLLPLIDVHDRHLVFRHRGGSPADHRILAAIEASKAIPDYHRGGWVRLEIVLFAEVTINVARAGTAADW